MAKKDDRPITKKELDQSMRTHECVEMRNVNKALDRVEKNNKEMLEAVDRMSIEMIRSSRNSFIPMYIIMLLFFGAYILVNFF